MNFRYLFFRTFFHLDCLYLQRGFAVFDVFGRKVHVPYRPRPLIPPRIENRMYREIRKERKSNGG